MACAPCRLTGRVSPAGASSCDFTPICANKSSTVLSAEMSLGGRGCQSRGHAGFYGFMPCHPQELQGSGSTPSGPAAGLVRFGQGFGALSVPLLLLISSQRQPAAEEPRLSPAGFPKSSPGSCPTVTAVLGWCLSTPCGHGLPLTDTRGWVLVPLKFKM